MGGTLHHESLFEGLSVGICAENVIAAHGAPHIERRAMPAANLL